MDVGILDKSSPDAIYSITLVRYKHIDHDSKYMIVYVQYMHYKIGLSVVLLFTLVIRLHFKNSYVVYVLCMTVCEKSYTNTGLNIIVSARKLAYCC